MVNLCQIGLDHLIINQSIDETCQQRFHFN